MNVIEAMNILDLKPGFNKNELHQKWREMARSYHPDLNDTSDAMENFIRAGHAYELLNQRFYGPLRGINQDSWDIVSREAGIINWTSIQNSLPVFNEKATAFQGQKDVHLRTLPRTQDFLETLILATLVLAAWCFAGQFPRIQQELYELRLDIAFLTSVAGASLAWMVGWIKSRILSI